MIALNRLLKTAAKSQHPNQHAAMVFKGKSIIAVGYNSEAGHAERNTLSFCSYLDRDTKGASIASIRIRNGKLNMAFPCENCYQMIKNFGIRWILYSDKEGKVRKVKVS